MIKLIQTGSKCSKWIKLVQTWWNLIKLVELDRNWSNLFKLDLIRSNWIKMDQCGSKWIKLVKTGSNLSKLDQIGSDWIRWLEDDLRMTWGRLRNIAVNSKYFSRLFLTIILLHNHEVFWKPIKTSFATYSMFPIKRTVFFSSVTLVKNTVRLIGNIEYSLIE